MRKDSVGPAALCVVGCGHWGKNLVRNFHALGSLYGFFDADPSTRAHMAAQYPSAKAFSSFEEVLDDRRAIALAIATPAHMHHEMGIAAIQADKDLFVEKPLALTWQHGMEMVNQAKERSRILMVGHLLRYHPAIAELQRLIASGVLGRIDYAYSNRLSMGKIRREENALWSFAPHDISVLLVLTQQFPLQVMAVGGTYLQPNIADVTISHLQFDRGSRAHIFVSWLHPYKEQRLVIIGSEKMAVFEDTAATNKLVLYDKRIELKDGNFQTVRPNATPIPFDAGEPLARECAHFIECVTTRRQPLTGGEEGVLVLQVLQACHWSLQMNGQPVPLHESRLLRDAILIS